VLFDYRYSSSHPAQLTVPPQKQADVEDEVERVVAEYECTGKKGRGRRPR
jgi:hypothetical protein